MSASAAILTNDEYEERKKFLEELKKLVISFSKETTTVLSPGVVPHMSFEGPQQMGQ